MNGYDMGKLLYSCIIFQLYIFRNITRTKDYTLLVFYTGMLHFYLFMNMKTAREEER